MEIKFLDDRIAQFVPAKDGDVGFDLRACQLAESGQIIGSAGLPHVNLYPGATVKIGTGIAIHQVDTWAGVYARSGLGCKGIGPRNRVGVVDTSYQGQIIVCLTNDGDEVLTIKPLDRIAQLVFHAAIVPTFEHVAEFLNETDRGSSGFNSTGTT